MNYKELIGFAGQCLALDNHPEFSNIIRKKTGSGEVNTDDLIWICSNHLVLPTFYLKFRKYGLLDIFPYEYAEQLQEIYELNRNRNLQILKQINEISASLNQADIPHLIKKDAPAVVEIHRIPVGAKYSKQFTSEMVFGERKSITGKIGLQ